MKNKDSLSIQSMFYRSFFFVLMLLFSCSVFSQSNPDGAVPEYKIPELKYPTSDAFVISYNIMDFEGADNTGAKDMTSLIQQLLDKLGTRISSVGGVNNGGVLFLPEGKYLVKSQIVVPKGVTIRGEWKKPIKGETIVGTIIVAQPGTVGTEDENGSLFILQPMAAIKDMAFWYPDQNPDNIKLYPPTIMFGQRDFFGNEYALAQNITLVNSYIGLALSERGGGAPNMFGIYGTPLKKGIEIDYIAEVGRVEGVDFSPAYWAGSGLPGAPAANSVYRNWIKNNGTGIVMRRNDWTLTTDIHVEGYFIGFHALASKKTADDKPNGQNYKMTFTGCKTAIYASNPQYCGIMFHKVDIVDCEYGLFVPRGAEGVVLLSDCQIQASGYAVGADAGSGTRILMNQCMITSGKIEVQGSTLDIMNSDIDNDAPQIIIGPESRAIITGNRFAKEIDIDNQSMYECKIDHNPVAGLKNIPEFPYVDPQTIKQKPNRIHLYVVTAGEFGAVPDNNSVDNTKAIQNALDKAKEEGGGIVYLPVGNYRVLGNLTIPTGVELKGASDIGSLPIGPGSILEVYAGKGDEAGSPFLQMEEGSGLRGVAFNYPEQDFSKIYDPADGTDDKKMINPYPYPYTIQVKGKDVYIVNAGFRAVYQAIDLFTYKCDNVYIEYPAGHVFKRGMRIGSGTENARISNAQFNTIGYACGSESKFGRWPNSPAGNINNRACYNQNYSQLEFFVLGDCKNLMLFNNFNYGSYLGIIFGDEGNGPSGLAIGHGIDSSTRAALYYKKLGNGGFDMITSQIVTSKRPISGSASTYIMTDPAFTEETTLFGADFWGDPVYGIELAGGTLNIQSAHFHNPGGTRFADIVSGNTGKLRVFGSSVNARGNRPLNDNVEDHFAVQSSIIDPGNITIANCELYLNNLTHGLVMVFENKIDRTGWIASASKNNSNAKNALDEQSSSRWDTGADKVLGDWFSVNMIKPQTFNKVLLDQGSSSGDYPRGYELYLSDNGTDWGEAVVAGAGSSGMTVITLPETETAQYVKIVLTAGAGNPYWSIHEFYIVRMESGTIDYPSGLIDEVKNAEREVQIYYADGRLFTSGLPAKVQISIYSISGQLMKYVRNDTSDLSLSLFPGIYFVIAQSDRYLYRRKIIVK
ncbi:MAG: discoidin domain-containing protein [Tannerellaceae bacterium]|jgi:hypothetical protein|nr:discoidin domain-containing protein [Tannerellaceae bacterium]